jgi:hypothetical protein
LKTQVDEQRREMAAVEAVAMEQARLRDAQAKAQHEDTLRTFGLQQQNAQHILVQLHQRFKQDSSDFASQIHQLSDQRSQAHAQVQAQLAQVQVAKDEALHNMHAEIAAAKTHMMAELRAEVASRRSEVLTRAEGSTNNSKAALNVIKSEAESRMSPMLHDALFDITNELGISANGSIAILGAFLADNVVNDADLLNAKAGAWDVCDELSSGNKWMHNLILADKIKAQDVCPRLYKHVRFESPASPAHATQVQTPLAATVPQAPEPSPAASPAHATQVQSPLAATVAHAKSQPALSPTALSPTVVNPALLEVPWQSPAQLANSVDNVAGDATQVQSPLAADDVAGAGGLGATDGDNDNVEVAPSAGSATPAPPSIPLP